MYRKTSCAVSSSTNNVTFMATLRGMIGNMILGDSDRKKKQRQAMVNIVHDQYRCLRNSDSDSWRKPSISQKDLGSDILNKLKTLVPLVDS